MWQFVVSKDAAPHTPTWTSLFKKINYVFICGCTGSSLLCTWLSLVEVSRGYSLFWCSGFSLLWFLLLQSMGSRVCGLQCCGTWVLELRLSSCGTWSLVAPRHVESSQTRGKPVSLALAGGFPSTASPRKVPELLLMILTLLLSRGEVLISFPLVLSRFVITVEGILNDPWSLIIKDDTASTWFPENFYWRPESSHKQSDCPVFFNYLFFCSYYFGHIGP